MGEFIQVCLVDGCGWTYVLAVREPILPITVRYPHPQREGTESQVIVKFDRSKGEVDEEGRQIYRMRGTGMPERRVRVQDWSQGAPPAEESR